MNDVSKIPPKLQQKNLYHGFFINLDFYLLVRKMTTLIIANDDMTNETTNVERWVNSYNTCIYG